MGASGPLQWAALGHSRLAAFAAHRNAAMKQSSVGLFTDEHVAEGHRKARATAADTQARALTSGMTSQAHCDAQRTLVSPVQPAGAGRSRWALL